MKINIKDFGYKKLLLGLVLLLSFNTGVYAEEDKRTEQQRILDEQNEGFDFLDDKEAKEFSSSSQVETEESKIKAEQERIDKIKDPKTKAAEQKDLDTRKEKFDKARDERDKENGECNPRPGHYCVKIDSFQKGGEVISGKNGIELLSNYVKVIYKVATGIIGVICVLIIVISGMQISFGGLSPEGVNQGKERIMQALLSLALLFGTALILQVVNPGFFVS